MFKGILVAIGLSLGVASAQPASAPRVALVIGNSDYSLLPKLPPVKSGVTLISDALGKAGFDVYQVQDFKLPEFYTGDALEFAKHLPAGAVCLIYYAGYAVQGEDDNYLLPVNFDPMDSRDL